MAHAVEYCHCSNCNDNIALPFNHITDNRIFMLEMFKMFVGSNELPIDFKTYGHLAFNPSEDVINSECNIEWYSNSEYYTDDKMDDISKQKT